MLTRQEPRPDEGKLLQYSEKIFHQTPTTFAQTVAKVKNFILQEFDQEIATKQLYYHNREHVKNIQSRANVIFQAVSPFWRASLEETAPGYFTRMHLLLSLCAVAHDMIQIFSPQSQLHTSRKRESGVSENSTIQKLLNYIRELNQQLQEDSINNSARFIDAELSILEEAISATICTYDPFDQAIYQPALHDSSRTLSPVSTILALADIGSLGMEGIHSYNQESSFIFLEENPDFIPILLKMEIGALASENLELYENMRQRLLKRARFQVNFAKSRLKRYTREIENLPGEASLLLTDEIFQHLNPKTIQEIELTTPTDEDTSLEVLVEFFKLDEYISGIAVL